MTAPLLAVLVLTAFIAISAGVKDPLAQCNYLRNQKLAPLIYLSQSNIAVIAKYSPVNYEYFKKRKEFIFDVTPVCFIKGYSKDMTLAVRTGTQKCNISGLSPLVEYPSLFFLRKDPSDPYTWLLLNGGEYQHQADTRGLLFGVGVIGNKFPQTCGLQRRRIPVDEGKCESGSCRAYCNFDLAPTDDCLDSRKEMIQLGMPKEDIPDEVPEIVPPTKAPLTKAPPPMITTAPTDGRKYEDSKNETTNKEVALTSAKGSGDDNNGATTIRLAENLFLFIVSLALFLR